MSTIFVDVHNQKIAAYQGGRAYNICKELFIFERHVDPLMRPVFVSKDSTEYLDSIKDSSVVAISGFNMALTPEFLLENLFNRYLQTGHPKSLFLETDALPAVPGHGLDKIFETLYKTGNREFVRGMMAPFMGFSPYMQKITLENMIPIYGWPIGIAAYWFREVASGRPGLLTKIGIGTFLDPEMDSGTLNASAKDEMACKVTKVKFRDEDLLVYSAPKPQVALIRATSADSLGNLSVEDEAIKGSLMSICQATQARPDPGIVIAQVLKRKEEGYFPRSVEVPYPLVDFVVESPPEFHRQSFSFEYDPTACLQDPVKDPKAVIESLKIEPKSFAHSIIARRVALEMISILNRHGPPILINLGVGVPALLSPMISGENLSREIVTVVESGPWGGIALSGRDFGVSLGAFAISTMPDMFTNYEGGIIDTAVLGFLQVDSTGNVNPSYIESMLTGPGGFPVIAEGTPRAYFAGTFTAGGLNVAFEAGKLKILHEGETTKFVNKVYKIFFSGSHAIKFGKDVKFFTERCILSLGKNGLIIEEIAPGIDIDKDIIQRMEFKPEVSSDLKTMHADSFLQGPLNLRSRISSG